MKINKQHNTKVNICWQVGDEKKCVTMSKEQAYATRDWVEAQGGVVFWTQVVSE